MAITRDDVRKVADLARLAVTDAETETYTVQLARILGHVEKLSEIDTSGVEPTAGGAQVAEAAREDAVAGALGHDAALSNAPEKEKGCIKVPQVIE